LFINEERELDGEGEKVTELIFKQKNLEIEKSFFTLFFIEIDLKLLLRILEDES